MATGRNSVGDALSRYLSTLRDAPRLTGEQERKLVQDIRKGHRNALDELIESNLSFVVRVAGEYRNVGLPFEDLLNEGNIGLIEAARRFDPDKNTKFITYAVWWIRKSILKAIANHANLVRIPTYQMKKVREILDVEATLRRELGRKPRREEISAKLFRTPSKIDEALQVRYRGVSLDEKVGNHSDLPLADLLEDAASLNAEESMILKEARKNLGKALASLTQQERFVLIHRFGLEGNPTQTLNSLGKRMRLSRERVRQIEGRAKDQLLKYFKRESLMQSPYHGPLPRFRLPGTRSLRPRLD